VPESFVAVCALAAAQDRKARRRFFGMYWDKGYGHGGFKSQAKAPRV